MAYHAVSSPIGTAHLLDSNKRNIPTDKFPPQEPLAVANLAFFKSCLALQRTVDGFAAHYLHPTAWTLTVVGAPTLGRIEEDRAKLFRRLRALHPKMQCIWVLAAHPRPHLHLLLDGYYAQKQIKGLLADTCFGFTFSRPLTVEERRPGAYDYLVLNMVKTISITPLPCSTRKWGVVQGSKSDIKVRVPVREIKTEGPLAEIWEKHVHLFEPENDAALLSQYRDYLRRFYFLDDTVSDATVDVLIRTRPSFASRHDHSPMSLAQLRHWQTWLAISKFVGNRSPADALVEARAMTAAAQAQAAIVPVPAKPTESAKTLPAQPICDTLAVTTTVNQFAAPTDTPLCIAVNLVPAPSASQFRKFTKGFAQGFATTAATTAACHLSVLLLTLLL